MPNAIPSQATTTGALAATYRRIRFIDRTIQSLKPGGKRVDYWDDALPGFGLRVASRPQVPTGSQDVDRDVSSPITRRDVRDLVEAITERRLRKGTTEDGREKLGAPIMANRVLALAKKICNFAVDREWIEANPAARLKPVAPERARDRVLSADEIRTLWSALDSEHYRIRTLFLVLFLTAQRSGEVSRMRWAQLTPRLDARDAAGITVKRVVEPAIWTIPASEVKNNQAHEVPLSASAVTLLQALAETHETERRRINEHVREKRHQPLRAASDWVFPSSKTDGRLSKRRRRCSGCGHGVASAPPRTTCAERLRR